MGTKKFGGSKARLMNLSVETCQNTTFGRSYYCLILLLMIAFNGRAQEFDPQLAESNNYVFEGNSLVNDDFIEACNYR